MAYYLNGQPMPNALQHRFPLLPSEPFYSVKYWKEFESIVQHELSFLRNQSRSGVDPDFMKKVDNDIWIMDDTITYAGSSLPLNSKARGSYIPCQIEAGAKHFIPKTLELNHHIAKANDFSGVPDFYTYDIKTFNLSLADPSHEFPNLGKNSSKDEMNYQQFAKKINYGYYLRSRPGTVTECMVSMHIRDREIPHFSNDDRFFKSLDTDSIYADDVISLQLVRQLFNYMVMHRINMGFIASDSHIRFICRPHDISLHPSGTRGGHIMLTKAYPRDLYQGTEEYQSSMLGYLIGAVSAAVKGIPLHLGFPSKGVNKIFWKEHWIAHVNAIQPEMLENKHELFLKNEQKKNHQNQPDKNQLKQLQPETMQHQQKKNLQDQQKQESTQKENTKLTNDDDQEHIENFKPQTSEKFPNLTDLSEVADAPANNVLNVEVSDKVTSQNQDYASAEDDLYAINPNKSPPGSNVIARGSGSNEFNVVNLTRSSASGDSFFSVFSRNSKAGDLKNTELSETLLEGGQKSFKSLDDTHEDYYKTKTDGKQRSVASFKFATPVDLMTPVIITNKQIAAITRGNNVHSKSNQKITAIPRSKSSLPVDKRNQTTNNTTPKLLQVYDLKTHTDLEAEDEKPLAAADDTMQQLIDHPLDYACYQDPFFIHGAFEIIPEYLSSYFPRKRFGLPGKVVATHVALMNRPEKSSDDEWHDMCSHAPYARNQGYVPGKFNVTFVDETGHYTRESYNVVVKRCEYSHSLQGILNCDSMSREVEVYRFLDKNADAEAISPKFYAYGDVWNTHKMLILSPWGRPVKPLDLTPVTMHRMRQCLKRLHKCNLLLGAFALEVFGIGPDGSIRIVDFRYVQGVKQMIALYRKKDLAQLEALFNNYKCLPLRVAQPQLPKIMCPPPHRLSLLENTAHQVGKLFKKDK
jgi:hypothetical protein